MPARDRSRPRWSRWFWKDWLTKTQDMSPEARGGYIDLMAYAVTNSPDFCSVPNDDRILSYAARLRPERWRVHRPQILEARWELLPNNRWEHPRLAEDARKWSKYIDNIESGTPMGTPEGTPKGTTSGTTHWGIARVLRSGVDSTETVKAEDSEPSTNGNSKAEETELSTGIAGIAEETPRQWVEGFQWFWEEYPRKVGKEEAKKSYLRIRPRVQETYDAIMAGLGWYKRGEWDGREQSKIPHPATWLNQRRWVDAEAHR